MKIFPANYLHKWGKILWRLKIPDLAVRFLFFFGIANEGEWLFVLDFLIVKTMILSYIPWNQCHTPECPTGGLKFLKALRAGIIFSGKASGANKVLFVGGLSPGDFQFWNASEKSASLHSQWFYGAGSCRWKQRYSTEQGKKLLAQCQSFAKNTRISGPAFSNRGLDAAPRVKFYWSQSFYSSCSNGCFHLGY